MNTHATVVIASPRLPIEHPLGINPSPEGGQLSRAAILAATHACFAEHGYDGTTIRAIASRLGCSVGSIYRYFKDKRDLLIACASAVFQPLLEDTREGRLNPPDAFRRYTELAAENDTLYRMLFWLSSVEGQPTPRVIADLLEVWSASLHDIRTTWALAHGLLMLGRPTHTIPLPPHSGSSTLPPPNPNSLASIPAVEEDEPEDLTLL